MAALRAAIPLVQGRNGRLILLHVLQEVPGHMVFSGGEAVQVVRDYEARVAAETQRLRAVLRRATSPVLLVAADEERWEVAGDQRAPFPRRKAAQLRRAGPSGLRRILPGSCHDLGHGALPQAGRRGLPAQTSLVRISISEVSVR